MKPRILLLMDDQLQGFIGKLHHNKSPYTFVDYPCGLAPENVRKFFQVHAGDVDAVAVDNSFRQQWAKPPHVSGVNECPQCALAHQ